MASQYFRTMATDSEDYGVALNAVDAGGQSILDAPVIAMARTTTGTATHTEEMTTDHAYTVLDHIQQYDKVHDSAPRTPKSTYTSMSVPTIKRHHFNGILDAGPRLPIKRRDYNGLRSVDPAWPIFCCDNISSTTVVSDPLQDFKMLANNPIPEAEWYWTHEMIDHLLRVEPFKRQPFHVVPTRYFLCTKYGSYREICYDSFSDLKKFMQASLVVYTRSSCEKHHGNQYQFSKFERVVHGGRGLREPELSQKQLSRQKRDIMVRKLSQGRQEEIAAMEKKLSNATIEEVGEVASHITHAREGVVSEVARKLSDGNAGETEGTKLQVALLNAYHTTSTMF